MTVQKLPLADVGVRAAPRSSSGWLWCALVTVLCAAASFAALWAVSGRFPLGHDEHQFITPGILTVRDGMLPYRDYPLFHVPYQPILNAAFLQLAGGDLFFGCRLPGAIAVWLTAVIVGWQGFLWLRPRLAHLGLAIAAAIAFAACITPVTLRAAIYAWNHQWPTLLTIASVLLIFQLEKRNRWVVALLAGAAIGIASGMRISFMPMLAPLGLAVLLLPGRKWDERIRMAASFSAGTIVALLPCLWLLSKAPENFLFGNFEYPKFSLPRKELPFWGGKTTETVDPVKGYLGSDKVFRPKPLANKLNHAQTQFFLPNGGIVGLAVIFGLGGAAWALWSRPDQRFRALVLLGGVPFLMWGSLAPSRFHEQYWYAPIPWLATLALFGIAQLPSSRRWTVAIAATTLVAVGGSAVAATTYGELFSRRNGGFFGVSGNLRIPRWVERLPSPILTLHPTRFAAAGGRIYPELSSGEFGWRSAHLLPKERRLRLKLLSPADMDEILAERPPASIFLGEPKEKMDAPLIHWAKAHGYNNRENPDVYMAPGPGESPQPGNGESSSSSAE